MAIDSQAFERYRRSPNETTTVFRLIIGTIIASLFWFAVTVGLLLGGSNGWLSAGSDFDDLGYEDSIQQFLASSEGLFATLATFAGIWIGIWIAMRFLHKEKLSRLFGNSQRISRSGFLKGFAAVAITSLLTELAYLLVIPDISRGPIALGVWALLVIPIIVFAFVQTSAEELLFRGYLQRGLAYRFRSPLVWAVLPTVVFAALHWSPGAVPAMNIGVLVTIGAFAALLALLVYATGNVGAAMGAHLGNNIIGFALISHEPTLGGLALFQGASLDQLAWTPLETATIVGVSLLSILLTWLLLLHPRSPLRVEADLGPT